MKSFSKIVIIVLLILECLTSCRYINDQRLRSLLVRADSMLISNQDSSAYALLDSIHVGMYDVDNDTYAHYCVLLLQAQDRCDVSFSDTLAIRAYNYYSENTTDAYHSGLAHYYLGKIASIHRNDNLSMQLFLKSTELFKQCKSDRYTFLSLDIASYINIQRGNYNQVLLLLDEAMEYAQKTQNNTYISSTYMRKACCYYNIKQLDSMYEMLSTPLLIKKFDYYNLSSLYYYEKEMYDKALLYNDSLAQWCCSHFVDTATAYVNRAFILYKKGEKKTAKELAESIKTTTIYQEVDRTRLLVETAIDNNNNAEAHAYLKLFEAAQDSILIDNNRNEDENLLRNIDKLKVAESKRIQDKRQQMAQLTIVVIGAFLIIISLSYLYMKRKKENEIKIKNILLALEQERYKYLEIEAKYVMLKKIPLNAQEIPVKKILCNNIIADINKDNVSFDNINAYLIRNICSIYRNFDVNLKRAVPTIKDEEIALCCLIRIGMKRTSIASILCLSSDGLKSKQTRMKKKILQSLGIEVAEWNEIWECIDIKD